MVNALLNTPLQSQRLALTQDDGHDLSRLQHSLDTNCKGHLRHLLYIPAKEPRVGKDSIVSQSLNTGSTRETGPRLVEGDVAVLADAGEEEVDAASGFDGVLVADAFGLEVRGVTVEDVDVGRVDVDVGEEVLPHEGVVGLGVVTRNADVFIHVEGDDVFERDL